MSLTIWKTADAQPLGEAIEVFVRSGATLVRKAINGLASEVEQEFELPLSEQALHLLCSRERRIVNVLSGEATGSCLGQKWLEQHRFQWPRGQERTSPPGSTNSGATRSSPHGRYGYIWPMECTATLGSKGTVTACWLLALPSLKRGSY